MNVVYTFQRITTNDQTRVRFLNLEPKPRTDGTYNAICINNIGVREPVKVTFRNGKFTKIIWADLLDSSDDDSDSDDDDDRWSTEEPIQEIPEHAEEILLTNHQKEWLNGLSTTEKNFIMHFLMTELPGFDKWLPVKLFTGFQKERHGERTSSVRRPANGKGLYRLFGFGLLFGDVQAGKSRAMHVIALYNHMCGLSSLITLRNLDVDANQMIDGIANFINKFLQSCESQFGRTFRDINILRCKKDLMKKNRQEYIDAITGKNPSLLVIMANKSQVGEFVDIVNECGERVNFITLIDEIDSIGYQGDSESVSSQDIYSSLADLNELSTATIGITATCFDVLFEEERLKPDKVFILPKSENYRGINNITTGIDSFIKVSDTDTEWIPENHIPGKKFVADEVIKRYFGALSQRPPFKIRILDDDSLHPINVLYKASSFNEHQEGAYEWITTHPEMKDQWSAIIYNGNDTKVYSPQFIGRDIPISNERASLVLRPGNIICKSSVSIRDIYTFLGEIGSTHIVTFAGRLADRGINFTNKTYDMQLTHQYYIPSKDTKVSSLLQSMRMCGVHASTGSIPMNLYTKKSVWCDIRKGYLTQEDIITSCKEKFGDVTFPEFMRVSKFNVEKIPKRKLAQKKKYVLRRAEIVDDEFGIDVSEFLERLREEPEIDDIYRNTSINEESDIIGTIVEVPRSGTSKFDNYNKVCAYISGKGWIRQVEIRRFSGITDTRQMNELRGKPDTYNDGNKGLLWRKNGREYEYYLAV
jgi:hypothetical protein